MTGSCRELLQGSLVVSAVCVCVLVTSHYKALLGSACLHKGVRRAHWSNYG